MKNKQSHSLAKDIDVLEEIISARYRHGRAALRGAQAIVKQAYQDYQAAFAVNGNITPLGLLGDEKERYYSLYDSDTETVAEALKLVEDLYGNDHCAYCGIDPIWPLDHYFPRSVFPEFAISLRNLIPSCTECNTLWKGNKWGVGTNRQFFNPYFDTIPSIPFLACTLTFHPATQQSPGSLQYDFAINTPQGVSQSLQEQVAQIERNFIAMNLNERYKGKISRDELTTILRILQSQTTEKKRKKSLMEYVNAGINGSDANTLKKVFCAALKPHAIAMSKNNWPAPLP